jgi:ABC-type branched-subunit amino acid transport system ATPase component
MNPPSSLLSVRGLTRRFGGLTAVNGLDFDLDAGEILGLIGPNGAGKSTTFNMIAGTLAPSEGTIHLDGAEVTGLPAHAMAARGVMRTFQHNCLFPGLSIRENVMTGMHLQLARGLAPVIAGTRAHQDNERRAIERADQLIDFVGLAEARHQPVSTLSFGQGRLLETARALAGTPRVMLFDEPAAGLTPPECDRLASIIGQIATQGIAVLLIEHDMRFLLALAHRVVVLDFGRAIATDSPEAIRRNPAVVAAYLGVTPGARAADSEGIGHA